MFKRRNTDESPLDSPIKRGRSLAFSADNAIFNQIESWVIRNCHQTARAVMEASRREVKWTVFELCWFLDMLPHYLQRKHKIELEIMRSVGYAEYAAIQRFHMWARREGKSQTTVKELSSLPSRLEGSSPIDLANEQIQVLFDDDYEKCEVAQKSLNDLYELRGGQGSGFNGLGFVVGMLYSCRHSWLFARDERVSFEVMACLLRVITHINN